MCVYPEPTPTQPATVTQREPENHRSTHCQPLVLGLWTFSSVPGYSLSSVEA